MFSPESEAGRGHCPAILAVGRPGKLKRYHHNLIVTIKADCTDHVVGNLIRWPCYLSWNLLIAAHFKYLVYLFGGPVSSDF